MNLIDHYGGHGTAKEEENEAGKEETDPEDANAPLILVALKEKIRKGFPDDYVGIIDTRELNQRTKGGQYVLEYLERKIYQRQYQFYFEVSFNSTLCVLNMRGTFVKNGLFVHLASRERILMTIRVINNLNRQINPLKLCINQYSGEISLEHSSFIDSNLINFKYKRNLATLTYRVYFLIQLLMKYRYIVLFYLEGEVGKGSEDLFKEFGDVEEVERRMEGIEKNLMDICFKTYNQKQEIDIDRRKTCINSQVQYLNQDAEQFISLFTANKDKKHSKVTKLANERYNEQHIQTFTTKQQEKFNFKINNRVQFINTPDWKREDGGGYGVIFTGRSKFKILDQEGNQKKQKDGTQVVYEEKLAMKIDKNAERERGILGTSKVLVQKEIISNIGHLSHPNIATYFQKSKSHDNCLYSLWQENSSLKNYIRRMPNISIFQMLQMMEQAAKGLYFLHKQGIVHLDFKPANIIVGRKFLIKLTDFGEAHVLARPVHRQLSYTFPYASPEIFSSGKVSKKDGRQVQITPQADVYSLGVTIYKCFFGNYIWGSRLKEYKYSKCSPFVVPWIVPEIFRDAGEQRVATVIAYLCLRCMQKEPESRAKLPWVITILQECRAYLSDLHYR